ncbi:MAG TPA: hypothetical protein VFX51_26245 [Solirubrobacteraceae bacterium]|nr:hypothetical protein [Solirubrobacteraceae bacterium]
MNWNWMKVPPVMERTLVDDIKVALGVFTGGLLGYLVFAPDDATVLLSGVIVLTIMVVMLQVVRAVWRRRHP